MNEAISPPQSLEERIRQTKLWIDGLFEKQRKTSRHEGAQAKSADARGHGPSAPSSRDLTYDPSTSQLDDQADPECNLAALELAGAQMEGEPWDGLS